LLPDLLFAGKPFVILEEAYMICPSLSSDGVGKGGLFADGKPHHLVYQRNKGEMILTVSNLL